MAYADYRAAIVRIAGLEADGEDVQRDIAHLSSRSRVASATIRHEVTETADLLR